MRSPEQAEQCLRNIQAALTEAGASLRDVVRANYVVPDASEFRECWPVLRKYFGEIRPASMMISAGSPIRAYASRSKSRRGAP